MCFPFFRNRKVAAFPFRYREGPTFPPLSVSIVSSKLSDYTVRGHLPGDDRSKGKVHVPESRAGFGVAIVLSSIYPPLTQNCGLG